MALITRQSDRQSQQPGEISIDLLPSDVRTTQKTQRWFQYGIAAVGTIVLIMLAITVYLRLQIAHQEDILAEEQAKRATLQTQVAALQEFEILKQTVDNTRATLAVALAGDLNWTKFLDDIDSKIPVDSSLTSLAVTSVPGTTPLAEVSLGTVQYAGAVRNMPALAGWLDTMSEITGQRFVYLSNGTKSETGVTFSASSHITEEMLSGRCTTEGSKCP
jgi:Tfp pilus assembly protein PilN